MLLSSFVFSINNNNSVLRFLCCVKCERREKENEKNIKVMEIVLSKELLLLDRNIRNNK
jgi:hypothetical protein